MFKCNLRIFLFHPTSDSKHHRLSWQCALNKCLYYYYYYYYYYYKLCQITAWNGSLQPPSRARTL